MDLGLKGKTALVLGAGGGLGSAIAAALAREGARVAAADMNAETAARTAAQIEAAGGAAMALTWNLADLSVIATHVAVIEARFGPVDVLVNNTGGPPPTPAAGQDAKLWEQYFGAMVLPVIAITDRVLPGMRERRWGRIITSASSGVIAPIPNLAVSNALRMGLVGWSKSLAREVAAQGVTVNVIVPGRIGTARTQALDEARAKREGKAVEQIAADSAATIPMGRYGRPEEYADTVAYLASERASYITGSTVRVDGGLIASV
jgi:3-oxoacyl-[acyl-carrier protein] reductase